MNWFKGKIYCTNCGKKYNFKNDHNQHIYICSGSKNYGIAFCNSKTIKEKEILDIIRRHCLIHKKSYENVYNLIEKINISLEGNIEVIYLDGKKSLVNESVIIY